MKYTSRVIKGFGKGTVLGFPTFNLVIPQEFKFQPGTYAALVFINQKKYLAALHFGPIPVFNITKPTLEIHLINYLDLSKPHQLTFEIIKYLRPVKNFSSSKALTLQIAKDIKAVKQIAS